MNELDMDRAMVMDMAPDLLESDLPEGPEVVQRFVLAWAVAPGGETVPGPGEPDADAVRAWAERALTFQVRGYQKGTPGRFLRGRGVIPDAVVDHVLNLARDEFDNAPQGPRPLMARVADRIRLGETAPEMAVPAPAP